VAQRRVENDRSIGARDERRSRNEHVLEIDLSAQSTVEEPHRAKRDAGGRGIDEQKHLPAW